MTYFNIYETTEGECKDFTDVVKSEEGWGRFINKLNKMEQFTLFKLSPLFKHDVRLDPDDLKLDQRLIDYFPQVMKDYINYASPLSDLPNEFLITPFLAVAGATIGKKRYVELGGIQIYPTIWTVLFAGSSTMRKSTALNRAKDPYKPVEEAYKEHYKEELRVWRQEKKQAEENDQVFDKPKPPKRTLYCSDGFSDLTFWESLRDNGSLISMVSEFTALWSEINKPRNSLRELALSIFDAEDTIRRNTRSGGDIELQNPVWCIAGATTLSSFRRSLTSTERFSGLLQRILPVCMEESTKDFKALTELQKPDAGLYKKITRHTMRLKDLDLQPVLLTDEAKDIFTEWSHRQQEVAEELEERLTDIGGYVSRLNVYGMKFALIFQQLDDPISPIRLDNMKASIALCDWLLNHVVYMLNKNYIFSQQYADRLKIREIIKDQPNDKIERTDLMNLSHFSKDRLDRALADEIEAGDIIQRTIQTGGRPLKEYEIARRA